MRAVVQRVSFARVVVDGTTVGAIKKGFLIFLGAGDGDTESAADKLADKICRLRIFPDAAGKTNCSLAEAGGEVLVVSQFTLYADCRKGNRPSFIKAGDPARAKMLYEYFIERCRNYVPHVECGVFGAAMKVELENDGPFTLMLEGNESGII